jgi:hypothetical protein
MMGRFAGFAAITALVGCAAIGAASSPELPSPTGVVNVAVATAALPLSTEDAEVTQAGQLRYLGGLVLSSSNDIFGGISGLRLLPDGRLLGVTDRGDWILLRTTEKNAYLLGVSDAVMAPLLDDKGQPLPVNDRDSESVELVALPTDGTAEKSAEQSSIEEAPVRGGDVYVSFERNHRVWLYNWPRFTPIETLFSSRAMIGEDDFSTWLKDMPNNGGPEAQAVKETAKIILSEDRLHANGGHDARMTHICAGCARPEWTTVDFGFAVEADFKPTDAHWLVSSDGRDSLLVLFRAFSPLRGVRAKLKLYDLTDIKKAALVDGETLMTLAPPLAVDNMEGLAVAARGDSYDIYLVSDDNFSKLQRSLLMKFSWTPLPSQR